MINIDNKIDIHFPMEMKPREQQIDLIQKCKNTINSGKKFVLVNAPTGSGKSYFAIMFSNWYRNAVNKDAKIDIITNSKLLQDQYRNSFDYIKILKGQSNYQCGRHNCNCQEGKEMNSILKKEKCDYCPYDIEKEEWIHSNIGTINFHLFDSFSLFQHHVIDERKTNLLFIDEATDFESIFCDYLSTKLSAKLLKKYGMDEVTIERYEETFNNIKTLKEFIDFIEIKFLPHITQLNQNYVDLLKGNNRNLYFKFATYTKSQMEKFEMILDKYSSDPNNWSLDVLYSKDKRVELLVEPIWGYDYLNEYIWCNYDHVVFMSGTILDREIFSYINGLKLELTDYYNLESLFPLENRPLYYVKHIGKMTYDLKKQTFEKQVPIIKNILRKYKDQRGIIHTINYEIADWIKKSIDDDRLTFHESENREDVYKKFIKEKHKKESAVSNPVIVSPSLMMGISLDDDLSRFQIIMKMPYPNISSNKIKSRQKNNRDWYDWFTCVQLIQMTGRSIRSETDHADTFILDSSFSDLLKRTRFLPRWFTDAIIVLK